MVVLSAVVLVWVFVTQKCIFNALWQNVSWNGCRYKSVHKKPLFVIVMYLYPAKYFIKVELE